MSYRIYLSGEIHSDWREELKTACSDLDIEWLTPVTVHEASDDIGDKALGEQPSTFYRDHTAAKINAIRIQGHIRSADLVVVRFGEKYKQWNAAFDAGFAAAMDKPYIVLHDESITHPLKEVDSYAKAVCQRVDQIAEIIRYVLTQA